MPNFTKNTSTVLCWSPDGFCCGIAMKRAGRKCKIAVAWSKQATSAADIPHVLSEGAKAINFKESSCALLTTTQQGWSMADIQMPALPKEQIRNAMAFELKKHTPIPAEKLAWGFRCITPAKQNNPGKYRIIYLKHEIWKQWSVIAAQIGQVDAIIPAPASLDPVGENATAILPRTNDTGDAYVPAPNGRIFNQETILNEDGTPKPLAQLLGADYLQLGDLEERPISEQHRFADAVLLAIYALTQQSTSDITTLIPLPESLKIHRNIFLLVSAVVLVAIAISAGLLYAIITFQSNFSQQRILKKAIAECEELTNRQRRNIDKQKLKKLQELQEEAFGRDEAEGKAKTIGLIPQGPPFPLALADISDIIDPDRPLKPWISSKLTWTSDTNLIKFTLEEPFEDINQRPYIEQVDLLDALLDSPYILDARGNNSNIVKNEKKRVRDFTITLGAKSQEEQAAANTRILQRKRDRIAQANQRQQKLEAEKKKQAEEAKAIADQDAEEAEKAHQAAQAAAAQAAAARQNTETRTNNVQVPPLPVVPPQLQDEPPTQMPENNTLPATQE